MTLNPKVMNLYIYDFDMPPKTVMATIDYNTCLLFFLEEILQKQLYFNLQTVYYTRTK